MTFTNKIVWITGASSGIGEALCYAFAQAGAKIAISARRISELERVKKGCGNNEQNCFVFPLDVTNPLEINETAEKIISQFGTIDILVNNAGITQRSLVRETIVDVDRQLMETDYFSAVSATKAVLPAMLKNGGGHIVVTSSLMGVFGFKYRSAYCAAKHALHGFFEALRSEEEPNNIFVTMLIPGWIKTNISLNALTKDGTKYNTMDDGQDKGIDASVVAQKVLKAIRKRKRELLIGGKETIMVYLYRYCRPLYYYLSTRVRAT